MSTPQGRAEILPCESPAQFAAAAARAADLLRSGEVVALPTETVYGLAANAFNPSAVARIFEIKGRSSRNPIIVHVVGESMARACTADWPPEAARLAKAFWPGPLTLVLRRASTVPDVVTAGGPTVGIRWPAHSLIQEVIRLCGFPLAAPSANISNRLSPTTAAHVQSQLGSFIPLIVDGGAAQVGIESTVVDLTSAVPRILRPGIIQEEALSPVLALPPLQAVEAEESLPKSPGMLNLHYAPRARLVVCSWRDDADLAERVAAMNLPPAATWVLAHSVIPIGRHPFHVCVVPHDPEAFARALYAELHRCDDAGAKLILVETPPSGGKWNAIRDRLRRASFTGRI